MKIAAKVFIIIGMVCGFPVIFPIIVGTIALKKLNTATCKANIKTIGILTLIFCNIFGGIFMLCLKDSDFAPSTIEAKKEDKKQGSVVMKKTKKSIKDRMTYAYIRHMKKWMFCPACQNGKMSINKKSTMWTCEECGYQLSADEFEDDYTFWWCDECGTYLNSQEGFDRNANKHICRKCGYENDTTFDNIKGICSDCGKILPDSEATLCMDCRRARRGKWLIVGGVVVAAATGAGVAYLASQTSDNENTDYSPLLGKDDKENPFLKFSYVTDSWMKTASEDELRAADDAMLSALDNIDYDSDEYLQLDLKRIDVVNTIASRFPLNLPHREHGWYLPNDDD